jgi:hypothetical protein
VKFLCICNFSIHRNMYLKKFSYAPRPRTFSTLSPSFTNRTMALVGHWRI